MDDRYFVCEDCAHTWSAPEYPDRCESCRRSSVTEFDNLEDAVSTMERTTKAEVHAVFTRLCASVGVQAFLPGAADGYYRDDEGALHHAAGWSLDHNPTYGGYKIAAHSGTGTGESEPMGSMRMAPREFVAAMHFALRALEARDARKRA